MHYTELQAQLKHAGFNCNIFDEVVDKPRIYLNGYKADEGEYTSYPADATIYLFAEPVRKQNDYSNPISGYGLAVLLKSNIGRPKEITHRRCAIKQMVMMDLYKTGFGLRPVHQVAAIGL